MIGPSANVAVFHPPPGIERVHGIAGAGNPVGLRTIRDPAPVPCRHPDGGLQGRFRAQALPTGSPATG